MKLYNFESFFLNLACYTWPNMHKLILIHLDKIHEPNPEDFEVRWTGKLEMSPIINVEQEQSKSGCDVNFKFVCEDGSVFYAKLRWGYGQCITNIRLDIK